jgi:archaetidylinositol phosphate synthase
MPSTTTAPFASATRVNTSLTAAVEQRILRVLAHRLPRRLTSDHLTLLGLFAQLASGAFYALAAQHRLALLAVNLCILFNWFGDSLDGTVARIRKQQRPRYGFYVDHMVDIFGALALMTGLAFSRLAHWPTALAMLVAFLMLSAESYLATYTLGRFQLSTGPFGPTEIRLLLIAANFAALRSPWSTVFHHHVLLFDLGGVIATASMFVTAIALTLRHTAQLFHQEPLA